MRFKVNSVRKPNITGTDESIDSLMFSKLDISQKKDISQILDFSFSDKEHSKVISTNIIIDEDPIEEEVIIEQINDSNDVENNLLEDNLPENNFTEDNLPENNFTEDNLPENNLLADSENLYLLEETTDEIAKPLAEEDIPSEDDEIEIRINNESSNIFKKIVKSINNVVLTLLLAFILAILVNIYVCRPSKVSGESMVPTLVDNETVYISQLPYVFGKIKFGDIVVIDSNFEAKRTFFTSVAETLKYNIITKDLFKYDVDVFWIKRVIGISGDVIEFKDDSIYRNGQKLYESYINTQDVYSYPNDVTYTVKQGFIFIMGDNRNVSHDSRHEGQMSEKNVVGKLIFH